MVERCTVIVGRGPSKGTVMLDHLAHNTQNEIYRGSGGLGRLGTAVWCSAIHEVFNITNFPDLSIMPLTSVR